MVRAHELFYAPGSIVLDLLNPGLCLAVIPQRKWKEVHYMDDMHIRVVAIAQLPCTADRLSRLLGKISRKNNIRDRDLYIARVHGSLLLYWKSGLSFVL